MRWVFGVFLVLSSGCGGSEPIDPWVGGRWIDLTHAFDADAVYWPTADGFELEVLSNDYTDKGFFYAANRFRAAEHGGTHIDSPIHFAEDRWTLEQIPVERLIGPAAVVDVSETAAASPDYLIGTADLQAWETAHGRIPDGAILLLKTGYGRYWPDRVRYMGTNERGPGAVADLHFPGLDPEAARWLVSERSIHAVGLDTPSIDYGQSTLFEAHQILFEKNVPAFENVANLDELPPTGAQVVALPMKIRGGSGGPLRVIAWITEG
jgi:kynurenine formamidase